MDPRFFAQLLEPATVAAPLISHKMSTFAADFEPMTIMTGTDAVQDGRGLRAPAPGLRSFEDQAKAHGVSVG